MTDRGETIAILSDLHANVHALDAVLKDVRRRGADRVFCLGDIVGYCSFPVETIHALRRDSVPCVRGNHDLMAVGELEPDRCGPNGRRAILWTRGVLGETERDFLAKLPASLLPVPWLLLVHSKVDDPISYLRSDGDFLAEAARIRSRFPGVRVCATGHTHVATVTAVDDRGKVHRLGARSRTLDEYEFYFLNPGSVGHPRGEDYRASYCIVEGSRVRFRKVRYDRGPVDANNASLGIHTYLGPTVFRHRITRAKRVLLGSIGRWTRRSEETSI